MKKIKAHCGIGFAGATYDEEFEFDDDMTDDEINDEINDWAEQFLETWWEKEEDQKLMNHAVKELKK